MSQYKLVHCNINGKDVERMVDVRASLTDMLRNDYRLTSVKKGCEVAASSPISSRHFSTRPPCNAASARQDS